MAKHCTVTAPLHIPVYDKGNVATVIFEIRVLWCLCRGGISQRKRWLMPLFHQEGKICWINHNSQPWSGLYSSLQFCHMSSIFLCISLRLFSPLLFFNKGKYVKHLINQWSTSVLKMVTASEGDSCYVDELLWPKGSSQTAL